MGEERTDRVRSLAPLLRARSLAVVGASATPGSFGHALLRQLLDCGYAGAVFPVNPGRAEIEGVPCFPSIADLPQTVDCAVLAVADERLETALAAAAAAGIPAAVIFGGLAVPGDPDPLPERLRRIARDAGMTLLGGNGMGFYAYADRLFVSGYPLSERSAAGGIGIVSHSGSAFSALANSGRGLRFSYVISPGQELTHSVADYLHFLVDQPETRVAGLFLETIRDPAGFVAALAAAAARELPVVALKVGRSERGRAMALAHSGALAGSDEAFAALCERWGVIQVCSLDEMTDTLELLAAPRRPRGGLALAGDSGGERALIVDRAAALGMPWADLGEATLATIAAALDPGLQAANPLDLWGSGKDWPRVYETCLTAMARDPAVGLVVLAVDLVRGSRLTPGYLDVAARVHDATETPIALMGNLASAIDVAAVTGVRARGIPVLMGTETALAALRHALTWRPAAPSVSPDAADLALAVRWTQDLASRSDPLDEIESKKLLAEWGIPVVPERLVDTEGDALAVAGELGWPVVLKTAKPGLRHKSDAGGVLLGLTNEAAVGEAYRCLSERFGPRVVVQSQIPAEDHVELFLGLTVDPQFGPLVSLGLGGIWVETLGDVVSALAPFDEVTAQRLLLRLRGAPLLLGARGRPAVDFAALSETVAAFSRMAAALGPALAEVDVNPLVVGPEGVVAVDALVVPELALTPQPPLPSKTGEGENASRMLSTQSPLALRTGPGALRAAVGGESHLGVRVSLSEKEAAMTAGGPSSLPGLPGVTVQRNLPCRMRDGVTLFADVYRPEGEGPFPVILMRLPYDKTQAENINFSHPSWYARHGYLVVVQDVRGRWSSEGEFTPFLHESTDGYDTIEWAARLPDANGRVGMYGFSYAGATQLMPATLRPPSLVTICPAMTASQYYEGWTYNQGALALAFTMSWAVDLAAGDARRAKDDDAQCSLQSVYGGLQGWNWYLPLAEFPPLSGAYGEYFRDWLAHPTYDDYWRRWSIDEDYSRLTVPALHIGGWYDVFLSGTVKNYLGMREEAGSEAARAAQKLLIGPWTHMPLAPVSASSAGVEPTAVDDVQLRWFDQFLKGEERGVLDAPVSLYVMGAETWRDYRSWPPPEANPVRWFLHSRGRANSRFGDGSLSTEAPGEEPPDLFTADPLVPMTSVGGHSCCLSFVAPMGPADQSAVEAFNSVLVYTSEPLTEPVELIGDVSVTLYAATTARDTDWTARLCEVFPDGRSINLQEGIVRARYRESLTRPSLLEPERVYCYAIPLGPVGVRIAAGHRLRLTVSGSDFPQWDRNLNTGGELFQEGPTASVVATQTVLHDAAHASHLTVYIMRST